MHSKLPKVLHQLAGKPLLGHVLDTVNCLQPAMTAVVIGAGGEQVRSNFATRDVHWVEQPEQRGTADAVHHALPLIPPGHKLLVLFGDVPMLTASTLQAMLASGENHPLTLLTAQLDDPQGYGRIVRDASGVIKGIVEHRDANVEQQKICEINTGTMLVEADRLAGWLDRLDTRNSQGELYLTDIVALAAEQRIEICTATCTSATEVLGINSRTQLAKAERLIQLQRAQSLMEQGVSLLDPARLDIRGELRAGSDVIIDINCVFEGQVVLGSGVQIGANCVLRNVEVGDDVRIHENTVIENTRIGANCRIGPFARLRPGTQLDEEVRIGNFVELKNVELGMETKVNHLSYVGDATVGDRVNIGAGTITCNYDGANKHRTVIDDDVFIGSNTQLVAPVTVGAGATVGAGTTLTRDVPPQSLAISRAQQRLVAQWKRPKKSRL